MPDMIFATIGDFYSKSRPCLLHATTVRRLNHATVAFAGDMDLVHEPGSLQRSFELSDSASQLRASSCGTNATCLCTNPKLKDDVLPCVESHCLPREALAAINLTSVACDFPIRDKHEQFNILTITLIVITGITVGLRFLEKIRYGPGLQLDDYVITGAFATRLSVYMAEWPRAGCVEI
ncbi:hypothetical protein FOXB_00988 [Fusarium oxysporum f. sp. conglutinans Fo5176]|uniref:CFEM domain-containing protein n=1 Tax=Fusarium oxysporum (strain Fo5176) TaxID=660025 RepID=F9F3L3_FUSOF|nr:hypothetical protein FOXB_00988 [Fusarium oxysporum f. sp. conglutinans Fo5176]